MAKEKETTAAEIERLITGDIAQDSDPDAATLQIIRQIMSGSEEDVFETPDLVSASDILDKAILVNSFRMNNGDFGAYFVIEAVALEDIDVDAQHEFATGDLIRPGISCGSKIVMAQLARANAENWLPMRVRFVQRETGQGYTVLRLVKDRGESAVDISVGGSAE